MGWGSFGISALTDTDCVALGWLLPPLGQGLSSSQRGADCRARDPIVHKRFAKALSSLFLALSTTPELSQ